MVGTTMSPKISTENNNNKETTLCSDAYKLDKEAPTAGTADFIGTMGSNDWYTSNVTVNIHNGSDSFSGHNTTTSNIASITDNTNGTTVTITTTDLAGNTNSRDYVIKVDKNSPTITANNANVEVIQRSNNNIISYFTINQNGLSNMSTSCIDTSNSNTIVT